MNLKFLSCTVFPVCGLLISTAVHAQTYGLAAYSYSTSDGYLFTGPVTYSQTDSHTGLTPPITSMASSNAPNGYASSGGNTSAMASFGTLHTMADLNSYAGGYSYAQSTAHWFDTVTVTSSTLHYGDPVTLLLTGHYIGTLSAFANVFIPIQWDLAFSGVTVNFTSSVTPLGGSLISLNDSERIEANSTNNTYQSLPIDKNLQQTLTTYVGATLLLDSQIDSFADVSVSGFKVGADAHISVDSAFSVVSQTPNVFLSRVASTPEPGSLTIMLTGLFALGAVRGLRKCRA